MDTLGLLSCPFFLSPCLRILFADGSNSSLEELVLRKLLAQANGSGAPNTGASTQRREIHAISRLSCASCQQSKPQISKKQSVQAKRPAWVPRVLRWTWAGDIGSVVSCELALQICKIQLCFVRCSQLRICWHLDEGPWFPFLVSSLQVVNCKSRAIPTKASNRFMKRQPRIYLLGGRLQLPSFSRHSFASYYFWLKPRTRVIPAFCPHPFAGTAAFVAIYLSYICFCHIVSGI